MGGIATGNELVEETGQGFILGGVSGTVGRCKVIEKLEGVGAGEEFCRKGAGALAIWRGVLQGGVVNESRARADTH